ncbi:AraC-like DNA-binding protein [Variovorax boronicumulans]|uniref:AraC family transcriptional regulator n=1 Tax=Variovorax boronicumulans TaxID=436515 RepID=UPI00278286B8|nr:AraC family transcriptional regulator [Variovorax boronicumulans]MDP9994274.1 AraC-like DNA-binding protein [Variovorax boronicumulans]MDQ0005375.1 AraC-like DNA-binding protein [Variovorax boronicumulans]
MKAPPDHHRSQVFGTPWEGVHGTAIESARRYGRHWHSTYGLGLLEHGAQRSASGRGKVDAYAGDLIATNPGEVHDGQPLGGPSRRWRMVYFDADVMAAMNGDAVADVALTRPVIQDARLGDTLRRLFIRLDDWRSAATDARRAESLACEESLAEVCGLLRDSHSTAAPSREASIDVQQVRDRLADELLAPPTLAELAAMTGLSTYQVLRRFEKAYRVPPHAWLVLQRTERARHLIRHGTDLAEAAAASGFSDQSHMTRIFTRQFGFTPGAWQRGLRF